MRSLCRLIIKFTQDESQPDFYGYIYACLLFLIVTLQTLLLNKFFQLSKTVGMRMRAAIITAVYDKVWWPALLQVIVVYPLYTGYNNSNDILGWSCIH